MFYLNFFLELFETILIMHGVPVFVKVTKPVLHKGNIAGTSNYGINLARFAGVV
jgi:hypothetical protein